MPRYQIAVNGQSRVVDVDGDTPLLWVLRDELQLCGTKYGCGRGLCGACTVHVDGQAQRACQLPVSQLAGRRVTTIEGLAAHGDHPLQTAWIRHDVPQCGYCQAGQIMQAAALLDSKRSPSDADIDEIMNVCRCGTYCRIRKAIKRAASTM
jgi:isoquinoline 1-oxidoreductase subunit alpha